jgi:hypothetical protein
MNTNSAFDGSRSLVVSQFGYKKTQEMAHSSHFGPAITISQQTGSGAHDIAERTAEILQQNESTGMSQWGVFDRQLVEKALEEHSLPAGLAKYMPEDRRSYVQDVLDELFGLRPPSWVLVPQVAETIQNLVKTGHVIVVGRGASVIASKMPGVFHVRLVASLPNRIERVKNRHSLDVGEAVKYIRREDRGFRRYTQAHFHTSIDDDLLYHLVINTDRIPPGNAATLIANEARESFERDEHHESNSPTGS